LISGFNQVQQPSIGINKSMSLSRAFCPILGGAISISFIVLCLYVLPTTELILNFNLDPCHGSLGLLVSG
jgi:hypothetical protein